MKACKKCKRLFENDVKECPYDKSKNFTKEWKGMIIILNAEKSEIAKFVGIEEEGMYAIKV